MQTVVTYAPRFGRRAAYAGLALLLLAAAIFEATRHATGFWQLAAFGLGPDVALLLGAGGGARGRLHPRAVPLYNLLHRSWGPALLVLAAALAPLPTGYLVGGLAWAFHVSLDRSVGYGLRDRDGFQRG